MLRAVLNKSRKQHPTKQHMYGYLPPMTQTIQATFTSGFLHVDTPELSDKQKFTYISFVRTLDAV